MGRQNIQRTVGRIGWIAGIAAFLMFGLLQGALVGGTFGLETGAYLIGHNPAAGDMVPRLMAAAGMLIGVVITGAMFVTCGLALGRLAGMLLGSGAVELRDLHTKRN